MRPKLSHPILAALFCCFAPCAASAALVNGMQAVVHDSVVTRFEVEQLTAPAVRLLERDHGAQTDAFFKRLSQVERDNLEQLIRRELVVHEFKTAGYSLPESVLDEMVEDEIRRQYKDRRTMAKTLQEKGITFEKFRERLRENFIVQAMRNKNVSSEIMVSPQKMEDYYKARLENFKVEDQVKIRMMTIPRSVDPDAPDPERMATEILFKLREGADFAEMAAEYAYRSQRDPGGDWYRRSELRKELAQATEGVSAGQFCDVVKTPEAAYIVQVVETKPEHYKPLSDVRAQIEDNLVLEERERIEQAWMGRLKKKTFIRYY